MKQIDLKVLCQTLDDDFKVKFPQSVYGYKRRELRAMKNKELARRKHAKFVQFLSRGRTAKEISEKFKGEDFDKLIEYDYEGFNLFVQRNLDNEKIYILLPEIVNEVVVQPRTWKHYIGKDDGRLQPYLAVQFPHLDGKIQVAPLFDVHYGNVGHKKEKFLSYIRWIKETPNVYAILGGDLMENALDDGRGMSYDQNANPDSQMTFMVKALAPIAHKILVAIPGNHEWRTYKHAGIDPMRFIADQLKIPYFDGPVFLDILGAGNRWTIYVTHGYGNSQTKGGKMNSAGKPKKFTGFIHFFLSGHVHDPVVNSETCIVIDSANMRLVYPQQWTVIAPSFLRWEGTYAYRAGYPPPGSGGVVLEMSANGDYRAVLK